ncbi:MAG: hypothetical protein ACP5I3_12290 [Thermoproteus sp.]
MSECIHYYRLTLLSNGVSMYATAASLLYIIRWYIKERARGAVISLNAKSVKRMVREFADHYGCRGELPPYASRHIMRVLRAILNAANTSPINGDLHVARVDDILNAPVDRIIAELMRGEA